MASLLLAGATDARPASVAFTFRLLPSVGCLAIGRLCEKPKAQQMYERAVQTDGLVAAKTRRKARKA
jgi:hypothetical protein